jgi:putative ABC transport system permease protein
VGVWHSAPGMGLGPDFNLDISPSLVMTYRDNVQAFDSVGAWHIDGVNVTGLGEPEQIRALKVTEGVLDALEIPPLLGRWISKEDDTPGTPEVAVLTYGYWQRRFGGDRNILGRGIVVDGRPLQVVGVMPESFDFMDRDPEIILPLRFERSRLFLGQFMYNGIARIKPGVTLAQANADISRILPIWMKSWPPIPGASSKMWEDAKLGPSLHPLTHDVLGNVAGTLWVVMGTVALVLLIACANVANLLLVRAESRQREWGIRAALGAGQGRLMRDSLAETVMLGLAGGVLGWGIANEGVALLHYLQPANIPRLRDITLDCTVLIFALLTSLAAGLLFGAIPALKYWGKSSGSRLLSGIRDAGRAMSAGRDSQAFRRSLVVTQVALSLILLITSGLMIRTFQEQRRVQPGVSGIRQVQTFRLQIPLSEVKEPEAVIRMQRDLVDKLSGLSGVTSAAFADTIPLTMQSDNGNIEAEGEAEGRNRIPGQNPPPRRFKYVSPGFLRSTGTRLIAGRDFTWEDLQGLRPVVMISENLARALWGSPQAALGKRIRDVPVDPWREIVGVVENVRYDGLEHPSPTAVYWPAAMAHFFNIPIVAQRTLAFTVRSAGAGSEGLMNQIRQAVWSVNPNLPLARAMTMQQIYDQSTARTNFTLVILSIAAAMALLLGMIGIYGVVAYTVAQRRREVGIRLALGAEPAAVRGMFLRQGVILSASGCGVGLAGAMALSSLMKSLLFGVTPLDPITYAVMPVVLLVTAVVACYFPARRAAAVDPAETLRAE